MFALSPHFNSLNRSAQVDIVALDKSGTLTMGAPSVTDVMLTGPMFPSREEALRVAAAVTAGTAHPFSRALVRACHGYGGSEQQF